jgi:predicted ATPase
VPEAQMRVIAQYKKELGGEEEWKAWLKPDWVIHKPHFSEFMHTCIESQIPVEKLMIEKSNDEKKPLVLDRSVLDGLTFLALREISNIRHIQLQVAKHIHSIGWYGWVFHLSILPDEFEKRIQEGRVITIEEATNFDKLNRGIYQQHGYAGIDFSTRLSEQADALLIRAKIDRILLRKS